MCMYIYTHEYTHVYIYIINGFGTLAASTKKTRLPFGKG